VWRGHTLHAREPRPTPDQSRTSGLSHFRNRSEPSRGPKVRGEDQTRTRQHRASQPRHQAASVTSTVDRGYRRAAHNNEPSFSWRVPHSHLLLLLCDFAVSAGWRRGLPPFIVARRLVSGAQFFRASERSRRPTNQRDGHENAQTL